jgi:hypothetical protein
MKLTFKSTLILFVGVLLFYTACKKTGSSPVTSPTKNTDKMAFSKSLAQNLVNSLTGTYGGVNIKDGISKPAIVNSLHGGRTINGLNTASTLCGFYVDTSVFYKINIGDTIKSTTNGSLQIYFFCKGNGKSDGFNVIDTLMTFGKAPGYTFADTLAQDFEVTSLNLGNQILKLDGNILSAINLNFTGHTPPSSSHNYYVLTGLVVDLSDFDITHGTAAFTSTGSQGGTSYYYTGTITFLGGHLADVVFNGFTFHVNLLTGVVTV